MLTNYKQLQRFFLSWFILLFFLQTPATFALPNNTEAIKKFGVCLCDNRSQLEVRDLKDEFTINEISEIYVPIFEARLVGPKKKVELLRIDAVRKKIL